MALLDVTVRRHYDSLVGYEGQERIQWERISTRRRWNWGGGGDEGATHQSPYFFASMHIIGTVGIVNWGRICSAPPPPPHFKLKNIGVSEF